MNKIIFLDIDGVLNSQLWYEENHKTIYNNGNVLKEQYHFDPRCVDRLNKIIVETESKIVISSSWRIGKSIEWFNDLFKKIKLCGVVIGKTKNIYAHDHNVPRGVEIKMYYHDHYNHPAFFEEFPSKLQSYVILDDHIDMLYEQRNNFIQTDSRYGLQNEHVDKAISILNSELIPNYIKEL